MQCPSLNQPLNFQIDSCIDEAIEMPGGMFETESIGVGQVRYDLEVEFCWKGHDRFWWLGE